jgi:hypothetical protein
MGGYLCYLASAIRQADFAVKREEIGNKCLADLSLSFLHGLSRTLLDDYRHFLLGILHRYDGAKGFDVP